MFGPITTPGTSIMLRQDQHCIFQVEFWKLSSIQRYIGTSEAIVFRVEMLGKGTPGE